MFNEQFGTIQIRNKIIRNTILVSIPFTIVGLIFKFDEPNIFILGVILGVLVSIIKLIMLEKSIKKSLDKQAKQAQNYVQLQFFFRYMFMLAFFVVCGIADRISFLGAVCGILSGQIAIHMLAYQDKSKRKNKDKEINNEVQ